MSSSEWTDEMTQRVIQQAMDLWFKPEIVRRQETGEAPKPFPFRAAQVIFDPDAEVVEVRLNEEVQALGRYRAEGPVQVGEQFAIDPSRIEGLQLTDADPNAGHLTVFAFGRRWLLSFDFRRNRARIAEHLDVAKEFLDLAAIGVTKGALRPAIENLFAGTELIATAELLQLPGRQILDSKSHSTIHARFNWWAGKLGNADSRYARLLNRLNDLRAPARYLRGTMRITPDEVSELLGIAEHMHAYVRQQSLGALSDVHIEGSTG